MQSGVRTDPETRRQLDGLLASSAAYAKLDEPARQDLASAVSKILTFLRPQSGAAAISRQMAPDLMSQIGTRGQPSGSPPPAAPVTAPGAGTSGMPSTGGGGPAGRVGEVTRATLSAIDFPTFVASLIKGTFQAIVDASIQQMEAYAELLKNVAQSVDRFMQDNISDGMARDYLADQYSGVFGRDSSQSQPRLTVLKSKKTQSEPLPSFFQDLGFATAEDLDEESIEQVIVPATRRNLAENRQRTLATMVLMGINRVVVDDGEVQAKLQFHIDASEIMQMRFDQTKQTTGNMISQAGKTPFSAQAVMVNTASLNAQTDLNVRADLTGQVKVKFRSETFPLERFADSAAIQLINSNARVPQPVQVGAPAAAPGVPSGPPKASPAAAIPAPTAPAPPPPSRTAPAQSAAQQSFAGSDPWAPQP
jgi:hypothetical protein